MDKANVILLEVQPRDPDTGARVTLRLAGGGADYPYRYGGQNWEAGLAVIPSVGAMLDYQGTDLGVGAIPQALQLEWNTAVEAALNAKAALHWKDAPFTLWLFPENETGTLPPLPLQVGKVLAHKVTDSVLQLAMADPAADLQRPLVVDTFTGAGGLEGPAEWEGRRKRRVWGQAFNIEGEPIDPPNNVYCFGDPARPWQSFDQVRDKGSAAAALNILGWQGSVAATFAALQAAAAPQGGGVAAPSIAMVKWWTRPAGILAADVKGETTGGYVETAASIAQAMVQSRAGPAFVAGTVAAANGLRTRPCGYVADDTQTTISAALDWLLGGVSLLWVLDAATGQIRIEPWDFTASVGTFRSDHADRVDAYAPVQSRKIGYRRNHRVHSAGDLAAIVTYGDGTPIDDYRPGEPGSTNGATIGVNVRLVNATVPTQGQVITAEGTAAAIAGQGALATQNNAAYGTQITGLPAAIQPGNILSGGFLNAGNMLYGPGGPAVISLQPSEFGANVTETRVASAIAGQGPGATATGPQVLNNRLEGSVVRIAQPVGGAISAPTSNVPGAIRIKLPITRGADIPDAMVRFRVEIYEYVTDRTQTYEIAGYLHNAGGQWLNFTARMIGSSVAARPVRFGISGGKWAVWIGDHTGIWQYPGVTVRDLQVNYDQLSLATWETGWETVFDTSAATSVTATVAQPTAGDAVFGGNVLESWAGTPATLGNFRTNLGTAAAIAGQAAWATYSGLVPANVAGQVQYLDTLGNLSALTRITDRRLTYLRRADGATDLTEAMAITSLGTAAAISGQGTLATLNSLAYGGPYLAGFGALAAVGNVTVGTNVLFPTYGYLGESSVVTAVGTAAAISGQGTLATRSTARLGFELADDDGTVMDARLVRNNRATTSQTFVANPIGGDYSFDGAATGPIRIDLPISVQDGNYSMVKFTVDVFEYNAGATVTYEIAGYTFPAPTAETWINCTAKAVGGGVGSVRQVRFGRTGAAGAASRFCVWIGDNGGTWQYPKVQVRNVVIGHSQRILSVWQSGWGVGVTGTAPYAVDVAVTNPTASDAVFGVNTLEAWNGSVATLGNFRTNLGTAAAIAAQADWATYTGINTSNMAGRVQRLNSGDGRALDGRMLNSNNNFGLRALSETPTFSQTNAGSSVTLDLGSNGKLYPDWGGTITLPSATFTGLAYSTTYYVWRNMPPDTNGTSYGISTALTDALGTGKVYLGFVTTMTSGGTGGGGGGYGGYGGGNCVAADALVPISGDLVDLSPAAFVLPGDPLTVLRADLQDTAVTSCAANAEGVNECVTLITVSGITLTLALNTPMTLPGGFYELAANMTGKPVAVLDHGAFRWESVERVDYAGPRAVAQISCGNATYAAGDQPGRYIFSHNNTQKP